MTSRVFEEPTRWAGGTGILRRLRKTGRGPHSVTDAHDPPKESAPTRTAVDRTRDRWGIRRRVDVEEIAQREHIQLAQRVFCPSGLKARRMVLFAGVEGENGCPVVCVRVGQTLTRLTTQSVCVVDANVRSPALHRLVAEDDHGGFATSTRGPNHGPMSATPWQPKNMWLLPSSTAALTPDSLLSAEGARTWLHELTAHFDYLVVYAPPINLYAESLVLSQVVDGVVLVLEANITRREIVRNAMTRLEDLNVPLLGFVLNDRTFPIPNALYRLL